MHHTVCHQLRDILNRLDSILIHNTFLMAAATPLTAAPTPSDGMGLNIVHVYIARNSVPEIEKHRYDIFVEEVKEAQSSYYTFPCERVNTAPEEPQTIWLDLGKGNSNFKFDSYAALHLLTAMGQLPSKREKKSTRWELLNRIVSHAQRETEMIGERMTGYLNTTIIPYLAEHHPDVLL
jgi:hypothetical protein